MTDPPPDAASARFASRRRAITFACACITIAAPWAPPPAAAQSVDGGGRAVESHGQAAAAPPRFGYYSTRWRRWPDADTAPAGNAKAATPVPPPRLEIPDAREESPPREPDEAMPRAAATNAGGPPRDGLTLEQRTQRLARQAAAAKAGTREQQSMFTRQLVAEILAAHDPELRCRIVTTAAAFDTPEADAICAGAMQDPHERVRMAACTAWGRRGGPSAVQLLAVRYESDANLGVRLGALSGLAELDDAAAIPAIAKALDDPDPIVRTRAMQALKQASGRDLGNDVEAWRAWAAAPDQPSARWSWLEAFRKLF